MENISTRLIIPAPVDTNRESGIVWYDVLLPGRGVERPTRRPNKVTSRFEAEFVSAEEPLKAVIMDEKVKLDISVSVTTQDSGVVELRGRVNGQDSVISGRADDPESVVIDQGLEVQPDEHAALAQWGRFARAIERSR